MCPICQYSLDNFLCVVENKIVYSEAVKWSPLVMLLKSICSSVQFNCVFCFLLPESKVSLFATQPSLHRTEIRDLCKASPVENTGDFPVSNLNLQEFYHCNFFYGT